MSQNQSAKDQALLSPQTIQVSMPSSRNGRRFALVSKILSEMNLKHEAVFPIFRRLFLKGLEASAIASPFCKLRTFSTHRPDVVITDQVNRVDAQKTIRIRYDFQNYLSKSQSEDILFLPILFHPNLVSKEHYALAEKIALAQDRKIRILFAGNCDAQTYDKPHFQTRFGLYNRIELMQMVENLETQKVIFPTSLEEMNSMMHSGTLQDKFVWIDTNRFKIAQSDWLSLLGKSQYFFCTPGVQYPYCQNLNEAMACGSVPILQYPDFYNPALGDNENCRAFKDAVQLAELVQKLTENDDMSNWQRLSAAAVQYHRNRFGLNYVIGRLERFLNDREKTELTWVMAGKE